jgi:uncharacterized protein YbjT (DUF2867 family)
MSNTTHVLLTGASGYVGGRLLRLLSERGCAVRCLARNPELLQARVNAGVEVVAGDVHDRASLDNALRGIDVAYYLIHSMGARGDFAERDRLGARNFAEAARAAGVRRIIYLGGLGDATTALSPHLRSRQEVGELLRQSGVPTLEFRASIVLGSGSLSFELVRALTERLPVMITPRWVAVEAQPIGISDMLAYLVAALDVDLQASRVVEIGGADRTSYAGLMREYARQRGLKRLMLPVPILTPYLSSLWLGLVTPVYARIGRKLIDSIRHSTVVRDTNAQQLFPIRPAGYREAIAAALRNEDRDFAETRWSDALSAGDARREWTGMTFGARLIDSRCARVRASAAQAFAPIRRLGGDRGWYCSNWLWNLRAFLDLLFGGVGMRRGRRDPEQLVPGDVLDFWRVERIEPDRRLLLVAEMKLPGRAWLEFEVTPLETGECEIRQTAIFDPIGVLGRLYWYSIYPLHVLIFAGMFRAIGRLACREALEFRGHV